MAGSSAFKGVAEKFRMSLLDGHAPERIQVEVGLEGVKLLSEDGARTLRIYPLNHISRWALRDTQLVLYTKTPVDVEERTVTLQAGKSVTQSVLDTLTCSCMQMCELLQNEGEQGGGSGRSRQESEDNAHWAASILSGGSARGRPNPEDVEFWHHSDKEGWLQSQGDKLKTWRRRWHVLKDGYIFRFMEADVNSSSKPRGLTDLSGVTEVSDAKDTTSRNNALKLVTPKGNVNYIADSETEQVEWISAIEAAICKILDDKDPNPSPKARPAEPPASRQDSSSSGGGGGDYMRQLEKSYSAANRGAPSRGDGRVKVVGYDAAPGYGGGNGGGGGGGSSSGSNAYRQHYPSLSVPPGSYGASAPPPTEDFSALSLGYGIAGAHTGSGSGGGGGGYGGGPPSHRSASNGYGAPPERHGSSSGDYGDNNGYGASDPNYAYDVFSGGSGQPSSNYPSMPVTVADYSSQVFTPEQGSASRHASGEYWAQAQQPPPSSHHAPHGGWDYGQAAVPPQPQQQQQQQPDYSYQQPMHLQQQQQPAEYGQQQQQQPDYSYQQPAQQPAEYGHQQQQQPAPPHGDYHGYQQQQAPPESQPQPDYGQPAYAQSYQPQPAAEQAPPYEQPAAPPSYVSSAMWQALYTPEGQQYWHNTTTGLTQWETPAGMA